MKRMTKISLRWDNSSKKNYKERTSGLKSMPKYNWFTKIIEEMEHNAYCPLLEDCPVYLNKVAHNEMVGFTYSSLYYLQGNKKYKSCKRFNACIQLGKQVPRMVLPNSPLTIEEIANH